MKVAVALVSLSIVTEFALIPMKEIEGVTPVVNVNPDPVKTSSVSLFFAASISLGTLSSNVAWNLQSS